MTMTVKQAIAARHSVRSFLDTPLTCEEISELLDAARQAPSSLNSQPWRFKAVTDRETIQWLATGEASRGQVWIAKAPVVIACCADVSGYLRDSQASVFFYQENKIIEGEPMQGILKYMRDAEASSEAAKLGAAAMNLSLAVGFLMLRAVEMGLGTCWVGMFNEEPVKRRLGLPPEMRLISLLAVGRPDEPVVYPRKRKNLEEITL